MLEGAKSMGAGVATITSAGVVVGIGIIFSSLIHYVAQNRSLANQSFGYAILGFAHRCCCIVFPNDSVYDLIRFPIAKRR